MALTSAIERELIALTKVKRGAKDDDQSWYRKLINACDDVPEAKWETVSSEATDWVETATKAINNETDVPPPPDLPKSDEGDKKPAKTTKTLTLPKGKKGAKAAKSDEEEEEEEEEAPPARGMKDAEKADKSKKGAKAAKAAPAPKAKKAKRTNGEAPSRASAGLTAPWKKIVLALNKKGTFTTEDVKKEALKNGVSHWFLRHVQGGFIAHGKERGSYTITPAGLKEANAKAAD